MQHDTAGCVTCYDIQRHIDTSESDDITSSTNDHVGYCIRQHEYKCRRLVVVFEMA